MQEAIIDTAEDIKTTRAGDKIRVGEIIDIDEDGRAYVDFAANPQGPVQAYYTHSLKTQMEKPDQLIGQKVLLIFDKDELDFPVIVDTLHSKIDTQHKSESLPVDANDVDEITVDGKRVIFTAEEEIVLKCGKSSIQLTRAGKVVIRGAYLLNRSSGVNRIKGGSVQIN
jgi:hypothetical protein